MKPTLFNGNFSPRLYRVRALLFIAAGLLLSSPLHAQIDFSVLNKWRGWRPTQQREPRQPRETREQPAPPVETWHPLDPAEERLREEHRKEKIRLLQSNWVPLASLGDVVVPRGIPPISYGNPGLGFRPSDPVGMIAPLGQVMSGTSVPTDAMGRAVAILATIQNIPADDPNPSHSTWGDAEAAFLAQQAALAMEGAPLEVIVGTGHAPPAVSASETLRPALVQLGRQQEKLAEAEHKRAVAYRELKALPAGGDSKESAAKREQITARFKKASTEAKDAKDHIAQVEIIILPPR